MSPTTQALSGTLAEARARAQREKCEVICLLAGDDAAPIPGDQLEHGHPEVQVIRVIVRPDEPILFCGVFPA